MAFFKNTPPIKKRKAVDPVPRQFDSSDSDSDLEIRQRTGFWASWLVVEGTEQEKPISALSPFAIQKGFQGIAGDPQSVKRLRNGSFLIQCKSKKQSEQLLRATRLVDRGMRVTPHKQLNSSKGVIRCPDLKGVSEEEIKTELASQGVTEVHRVTIRKGTERVSTNTLFLTFCNPVLPPVLKVGYLNVRVQLYVPSPMRCFKCQKFGHVRDRCSGEEVCGVCCKATHDGPCTDPAHCANCGGDHPSSSRNCPVWIQESSIQKVKTEKKISFFEARRQVVGSQTSTVSSYASAVRTVSTRSVCCQTDEFIFTKTLQGRIINSASKATTSHSKVGAPGGGTKSATPQTARQSTPSAAGQIKKPALPPRTSVSSARAGKGVQPSVEMVEMRQKPPPSPKSRPSSPAGKSTSRSEDPNGPVALANKFAPLAADNDEEMT